MSAQPLADLSKLCVHTITTKPWAIETAAEKYAQAGVQGISVWRNTLQDRNPAKIGDMLTDVGLSVVSLVRGGFFPAETTSQRDKAIKDNLLAIDEAAALGAPMIVLVCGAWPGQSMHQSRQQIQLGIEKILPHAERNNIKLAIEPLHPMYADTRSAINTLKQANDMADAIASPLVGVAVDVYHLWWDPELQSQIKRCGENGHLFAFHICDWKVEPKDMLNDRGLMGEGCINIREIRGWVEQAGFDGFNEVEIFSNRYWSQDQDSFLANIVTSYLSHS